MLRQRVELRCNGVVGIGGLGPVRGEDVVSAPPEEERVRLREALYYDRAHVLIGMRKDPAAVAEAAGGVLLRAAGSLHDAIHTHESRYGQLSHGNAPGLVRKATRLRHS